MPFRRVNAWSRPVSPTMHERFGDGHRLAARNGGRHGGGCQRIVTIVEPEREKSFGAHRSFKRANGQELKRPRPEARRRRAGPGRTRERSGRCTDVWTSSCWFTAAARYTSKLRHELYRSTPVTIGLPEFAPRRSSERASGEPADRQKRRCLCRHWRQMPECVQRLGATSC
jgi:hypothetical protein